MPAVWTTKSATRWASTIQARTGRVGAHPAGLTAAATAVANERREGVRQPADRAQVGAVGRHGDRRPADLWRRSAASERRSPSIRSSRPIGALARGQVGEQLGEQRGQVVEQGIGSRIATDEITSRSRREAASEAFARAQERLAGALGGGAAARVDLTGDDDPAHRPAVAVKAGVGDRDDRIGGGREQALELIALGELERGKP